MSVMMLLGKYLAFLDSSSKCAAGMLPTMVSRMAMISIGSSSNEWLRTHLWKKLSQSLARLPAVALSKNATVPRFKLNEPF